MPPPSIRTLSWPGLDCVAPCLGSVLILVFAPLAIADGALPTANPQGERTTAIPVAGTEATVATFNERLLQVDINRQQLDETVLVLEDGAGALYLWSQDLQRWRFQPPAAATAIDYQGEKYYPLTGIADVLHTYDPKALTLNIEARMGAFNRTRLTARYDGIAAAEKSNPGGFFNYDLFVAHSPESTQRSGLFELGYFNRLGVGTTDLLAERLGRHARLTRLDSTWTADFPERMRSLRLGDTISSPGAWGRSVRFGGIQFGTNFGTRPGFISFPQQSVAGQAALPTTVDVFVNNALVSRQEVPPGPFSISKLPVITGAGEVQLVMRDLLGREQVVTQPFYGSQALLGKGLAEYSYELGQVRRNFGVRSNDYGEWLGAGTYRRGISESLTAEVRAEAMQHQVTLGGGGDFILPRLGTFNAYVAGSRTPQRSGSMLLLGMDRQSRPWSFGARSQWASSGFIQIGMQAPELAPARVSSMNLSYASASAGSIGAAYVEQRHRDRQDVRVATLSYSASLGALGSLSVIALRDLVGPKITTVFAMLNIPLTAATSLSLSSQSVHGEGRRRQTDFTANLQRNLPAGEGYGYQLQARSNGSREASLALQNNVGTYTAGIAQGQGSTSTRIGASGGAAVLGGDLFWSRRIDQSFAVARIPDYPDVRIEADNQLAGRTDAAGNALIPRLRAYDRNVLSIDQRDLPLDAEIAALKIEVVPSFRSGIDVEFPVKRSHGATFTVLLEDGRPLPVGASVREVGKEAVFPVGYDGEVYVTGLGPATALLGLWEGKTCSFEVSFVAGADPLPDLGRFVCREVLP